MNRYLSINEIAVLFNVNRQTLHYYDKINLFKPEYRDPNNGYRNYSYQQIAQFAFIVYLRTIGFSLEKIKVILNYNDISRTMEELRHQSQLLESRYTEIFKMNKVIQRKLLFVQNHTENINEIKLQTFPKRAYVKVGEENDLYENEIFYYFPTVVFYKYNKTALQYNKIFGAYLDSDESDHFQDRPVEYIEEETYLCLYHKGPYSGIPCFLAALYDRYKDLSLSPDFICINIVDQFLEKDPQNFITEIQIPIDYIVTI